MKTKSIAALLVFCATAPAMASPLSCTSSFAPAQVAHAATTCSGEWRWPVKTLADPLAGKVNFTPRVRSVGFLRNLQKPSGLTSTTPRLRGAERRTYRVKVALLRARVEDDRDIRESLTI